MRKFSAEEKILSSKDNFQLKGKFSTEEKILNSGENCQLKAKFSTFIKIIIIKIIIKIIYTVEVAFFSFFFFAKNLISLKTCLKISSWLREFFKQRVFF